MAILILIAIVMLCLRMQLMGSQEIPRDVSLVADRSIRRLEGGVSTSGAIVMRIILFIAQLARQHFIGSHMVLPHYY